MARPHEHSPIVCAVPSDRRGSAARIAARPVRRSRTRVLARMAAHGNVRQKRLLVNVRRGDTARMAVRLGRSVKLAHARPIGGAPAEHRTRCQHSFPKDTIETMHRQV